MRPWCCSIVCLGLVNTSRARLSPRSGSLGSVFRPPSIWRVWQDSVRTTRSRRASARVGRRPMRRRVGYTDLGSEYVTHLHVEQQRQRLVKKLEALGVKVTLE